MKRIILALLVVVPVVGIAYWVRACPCDRTPGVYLWGTEVAEPVSDWSMANQVPLCQVQVSTALLPQALNLNCWADDKGVLYLSCGGCAEKRWSNAAVANNQGRLRVGSNVYPVTLTRVMDATELDAAWKARAVKVGGGGDATRPADWWSFRVASR